MVLCEKVQHLLQLVQVVLTDTLVLGKAVALGHRHFHWAQEFFTVFLSLPPQRSKAAEGQSSWLDRPNKRLLHLSLGQS